MTHPLSAGGPSPGPPVYSGHLDRPGVNETTHPVTHKWKNLQKRCDYLGNNSAHHKNLSFLNELN